MLVCSACNAPTLVCVDEVLRSLGEDEGIFRDAVFPYKLDINDTFSVTLYSATNPHQWRFDVIRARSLCSDSKCSRPPPPLIVRGPATDEHSWFPPYRFPLCFACAPLSPLSFRKCCCSPTLVAADGAWLAAQAALLILVGLSLLHSARALTTRIPAIQLESQAMTCCCSSKPREEKLTMTQAMPALLSSQQSSSNSKARQVKVTARRPRRNFLD